MRAGLEDVGFAEHPKVALAALHFVPGYVVGEGPRRDEIWNGLALVVLGARTGPRAGGDDESLPAAHVYRKFRDGRVGELEERLARAERALDDITSSASWRLTSPLRAAKARARRAGDGSLP